MAQSTSSTSQSPPVPLRVLTLSSRAPLPGPNRRVCMARQDEGLLLIFAEPSEDDAYVYTTLSVQVPQNPFPGHTLEGNELFWLKNYSENKGIQEELERAGWIRSSGSTIKQGFVELPMVELRLKEAEIAHNCSGCMMFELLGDDKRFSRCSKCKKRYYCSVKCQTSDWQDHKKICKLLAQDNLAGAVNHKNKEMTDMLKERGFQTVTLT